MPQATAAVPVDRLHNLGGGCNKGGALSKEKLLFLHNNRCIVSSYMYLLEALYEVFFNNILAKVHSMVLRAPAQTTVKIYKFLAAVLPTKTTVAKDRTIARDTLMLEVCSRIRLWG